MGVVNVIREGVLTWQLWWCATENSSPHGTPFPATNHRTVIPNWTDQGPVSISDKALNGKISQSLKSLVLVVVMCISLWSFAGPSAALLSRCLQNSERIENLQTSRFYDRMYSGILKRAPRYYLHDYRIPCALSYSVRDTIGDCSGKSRSVARIQKLRVCISLYIVALIVLSYTSWIQ